MKPNIVVSYRTVLAFCLLAWFSAGLSAQCPLENTSFQSGERLSYDLYFKYGILYTKAGRSSLTVDETIFQDREAYRMCLIANSSGIVNSIFSISDTLWSFTTKDIVPLAYVKNAHEGGDYRTERVSYEYSPGNVRVRNVNKKDGKLRYDATVNSPNCMYDMLSILYFACTLKFETMKKGDIHLVSFLSGKKKVDMEIEHRGFERVSANDGRKYDCVELVLSINDKAFDDKEEAMRVFITRDRNRIPVRIDSKLKVGSTRAILKAYKGQRN